MKHNIKHRKLNRTSSHRKALLMNLSNSLLKHEQITTTLSKAKDQVYSWCEDTGYLLHKDQKKVIIFASHSFDDDGELTVGNTTVYPRSVVKKIEVLK